MSEWLDRVELKLVYNVIFMLANEIRCRNKLLFEVQDVYVTKCGSLITRRRKY